MNDDTREILAEAMAEAQRASLLLNDVFAREKRRLSHLLAIKRGGDAREYLGRLYMATQSAGQCWRQIEQLLED